MAGGEQLGGDDAADVSGPTGHQDFHGRAFFKVCKLLVVVEAEVGYEVFPGH